MLYLHLILFIIRKSRLGYLRVLKFVMRCVVYGTLIGFIILCSDDDKYDIAIVFGLILAILAVLDFKRKKLRAAYKAWKRKRAPVDYTKL